MRWTQLIAPQVQTWFPAELKESTKDLAGKVDQILTERDQIDRMVQEARSQDPSEMDVSNIISFPSYSDSAMRCLQRELLVRRELGQYYEAYYQAAQGHVRKVAAKLQKVEADVRQKLVEVGYRDLPVNDPDPCKIIPDFLHRHPQIREARQAVRAAQAPGHTREWANANTASIAAVTSELERLRDQALRGLPT